MSDKLQHRLSLSFTRHGLDAAKFVHFIPWQSTAGFYGLMRQADVFLDTIGFSGFNTALKALECNLPVVTVKGQFMRGRLASGILESMGVTETVMQDTNAYVGCVVKLIQDKKFNQAVRRKIKASIQGVYRDVEAIRALEKHFVDVVVKTNPNLKLPKRV
jgi:predicted O-linked N-acetylglucosamine transferase (SPINDLY family)